MTRQMFENWYSDGGKFPKAIERNGDGYKLKHAHDSWTAWQACWKIQNDITKKNGFGGGYE